MGSRTGASYQSIAGGSWTIRGEVSSMTTAISCGGSPGVSAQISQEQFEVAANLGLRILMQSKPGISTLFHIIRIGSTLLELYPKIVSAYKSGGENAVIELLATELLEQGIRAGANMLVGELTECIWSEYVGEHDVASNENDDQLAKIVLKQGLSDLISAAKEELGIDENYLYHSIAKRAIKEFVVALSESRDKSKRQDCASDPYSASSLISKNKRQELYAKVDNQAGLIVDQITSHPEVLRVQDINTFQKIFIKAYKQVTSEDIPVGFVHKHEIKHKKMTVAIGCSSATDVSGLALTGIEAKKPAKDSGRRLRLSVEKYQAQLKKKHIDLLNYAVGLYRLEYYMKIAQKNQVVRPEEFRIALHADASNEVKFLMQELHTTLLGIRENINFVKVADEEEEEEEAVKEESCDTLLLFSGGLDSLAGYLSEQEKYKNAKFLFVNHSIGKLKAEVVNQMRAIGREKDLIVVNTNGGGGYLQQTRGFLFLTIAAVIADIIKAKKIVISECGVTKYQPPESVADEITKTTHPHMIEVAKMLYNEFNIDVELYAPFDNNTKTEIMNRCSRHITQLTHTTSCRSGARRDIMNKKECGHCMACVMKNISLSYITGKNQDDLFFLSPLTHDIGDFENAAGGKHWRLDNQRLEAIFSTIKFCSDVLSNTLRPETLELIRRYDREDLFKRYSEDMIYGLCFMDEKGFIKNTDIKKAISVIKKEPWFNKKKINDRQKIIKS